MASTLHPYIYVIRYIMRLSPSIFIFNPSEVSYRICSWNLACEFRFTDLRLSLDLCARIFSRLGIKICKALKLDIRMLG